jgi:hypothetical protein
MRIKYVLLVIIAIFGPSIYADTIPMVMYTEHDALILRDAEALRDTLGINYIYGTIDDSLIQALKANFKLIKWSGSGRTDFNYLSGTNYFTVAANDSTSLPSFDTHRGSGQDGFWTNDSSGTILSGPVIDGLWFVQNNRAGSGSESLLKTIQIKMKIDADNTIPDSTLIGAILVHLYNDSSETWDYCDSIKIKANAELKGGNTIYVPSSENACYIGNPSGFNTYNVKYSFAASGIRKVYLDTLRSFDLCGGGLIRGETYYDQLIEANVNENVDVDYLWLRDEPKFDNFQPFAKVRQLVNSIAGSDKSITAYWLAGLQNGWEKESAAASLRSFEVATHQSIIVFNDYPFFGGYINPNGDTIWFTAYTGYGEYTQSGKRGIQKEIELTSQVFLEPISEEIRDGGILEEFWQSPQWMGSKPDNSNYFFRHLTRAELRLQIGLGLCYGAKGFNFWRYDSGINDWGRGHYDTTEACWQEGFYSDATFSIRDSVKWQTLRDDINPFLKAIGDIYLPLKWQRAYACSSGVPISPPLINWVSSISAISNSPDSNPDLGWFHVGEFIGSAGDSAKYIMLLNRACSQDTSNPTEAPSITATVRFNPNTTGSNYVLITDLADTIIDSSGQWIGVPRTTYSGVMPDGKIPYSITLKAGEGKLIKISPASEFRGGQIDTTCDYQGQIFAYRDIVIPSGHEMRVKSPAIFEIAQIDSGHSGISSSLIEIINNGTIKCFGSFEDTVKFRTYPISGPGSWYGIRDRSSGYDTLTYCAIKYAYNGFRAETNANALIRHCEISYCENNAVYLYNTNSSLTTIDSSFITDNGNSAINSNSSYFFARANTITDNDAYGIYFQDQYVSIPQLIISDNTIEQGDGSAQAGICIRGNQTSNNWPWANLSGNFIEGFDQEGVYLYYCKTGSSSAMALSGGNYLYSNNPYGLVCQESSPQIYSAAGSCEEYNFFVSNTVHGIYFIGSSTSKVSKASFEGNGMANVSCGTNSTPNFGDDTFNGENSFSTVDSSDFDIMNFTSKKINAKGNWWGEDTVDTDDFYPSINSFNLGRTITDPCPGIPSLARYESGELIPTVFALHQNYPNPFNPSTTIEFDLPQDSWVRLSVYNVLGQRIKTLLNAQYAAGTHEVIWDGRNESGGEVSSGVYFYLLETDSFRDAKKMLMIR